MKHTIIYHGRYSLNFKRLKEHKYHPDFFIIKRDERKECVSAPKSKNVKGIVFGYMEKSKERLPREESFFAVRVKDVVLRNPIILIPKLHTDGKWFGPKDSQFGDKSAKKLLSDIIKANPEQSAALMKIYDEFFG